VLGKGTGSIEFATERSNIHTETQHKFVINKCYNKKYDLKVVISNNKVIIKRQELYNDVMLRTVIKNQSHLRKIFTLYCEIAERWIAGNIERSSIRD